MMCTLLCVRSRKISENHFKLYKLQSGREKERKMMNRANLRLPVVDFSDWHPIRTFTVVPLSCCDCHIKLRYFLILRQTLPSDCMNMTWKLEPYWVKFDGKFWSWILSRTCAHHTGWTCWLRISSALTELWLWFVPCGEFVSSLRSQKKVPSIQTVNCSLISFRQKFLCEHRWTTPDECFEPCYIDGPALWCSWTRPNWLRGNHKVEHQSNTTQTLCTFSLLTTPTQC